MKRTMIVVLIAAMAAFTMTACGNDTVSTSDEAANSQTHTVEYTTTPNIEVEEAVKENGLKIDKDGNITDSNGSKVEVDKDGKVEIKTANGETVKVDTQTVKAANFNQQKVQEATKRAENNNNNSNSSSSKSNNKNNTNNPANNSSNQSNKKPANSSSESSKPASKPTNSNSQSSVSDPHEGKTWHEAEYKTVNHPAEYKDVWVVDVPAHTEEEPIYEWQNRTICFACGADITGNVPSHGHYHRENGDFEKFSYGTQQVQVQTGTKTVNVPEQGHYEKKLVKAAWSEKVLVKEAGWY